MIAKSRAMAILGGVFGVMAIGAVVRNDIVSGILMFAVSVAFALWARKAWTGEQS
ncbi:MAG: hypothetical protein ABIO43_04185 [Sphingomicrobium sp.]